MTPEQKAEMVPRPRSWILVDFENTVLSAAEREFPVSFSRLRDFLRNFGDIVFAEVFVGPKHRDADRVLADADWRVIACPLSRKEMDAVDATLLESVQRIISHFRESVDQLVVVTRDRELLRSIEAAAKDRGVRVLPVDILTVRKDVEGEDASPQIYVGPEVRRFTRILRDYQKAAPGGLAAEEIPTQHLAFVKDVLEALTRRDETTRAPFRVLEEYANSKLEPRWDRIKRSWLRAALTALAHLEVLSKHQTVGGTFTYYTLNRSHPLVELLAEGKSEKK